MHRIAPEARIWLVRTPVRGSCSAAVPAAGSGGVPPRERTRSETPRKPAGADARATNPIITSSEEVREKFRRVKPLKDISVTQRGWTLDVLNAIRRLGKTEFTTTDAYIFERELEQLHPDNSDKSRAGRHVRDNPVKDFVSRGRNPPAASGLTRPRFASAPRPW